MVQQAMRTSVLKLVMVVAVAVPLKVAAQGIRPSLPGIQFQLSRPHKVAPFPLVLNAAVRAYVDSYLEHSEGLRLCYERSAPFLHEMMETLRQRGVPADLVY